VEFFSHGGWEGLLRGGFPAFNVHMGFLSRILRALGGRSAARAEDIVFEPISGPGNESPAPIESPLEPTRGAPHRVTLGELMPRVPHVWRRSGDWAAEQMIELPAAARLNAGAERPLAFSLRYLAKSYPRLFRDPGATEKDSGVDLAMEPLRDPEPAFEALSSEIIEEVEVESETFTNWEGEVQSRRERDKEAKETKKVLERVQLPSPKVVASAGFDILLEAPLGEKKGEVLIAQQEPVPLPKGAPVNGRLKRILEAYAEGLPAGEREAFVPKQAAPLKLASVDKIELTPKARARSEEHVSTVHESASREAANKNVSPLSGEISDIAPVEIANEPPALQQMRFEELGLSLSKFPEVRGFALWVGDHAMQTGEMWMDTQAAPTRFRMEKILESATLTQGAQDGFLSVTVYHARGGVSVFGGSACLVAVAHQSDGMPAHLRSWLCGWVSQPLRG